MVALGPFRCPIQNDHFKMEGRPFSHQKWTPSEMGPVQPNRALGIITERRKKFSINILT